jgi:anti-anti-sigma regulatory factor
MARVSGITPMIIYQHDSAMMYRFVLRGELAGQRVQELEQAWNTAKSILNGKELVIDVSGITDADQSGVGLLVRMRESGARLTATLPPESEELLRSLGLPVPAPRARFVRTSVLRLLRAYRS